MGNKREFKKYAEALGSSVCEEIMCAYYNVEGADKDKLEQALTLSLGAIANARQHANIYFDKGTKAFETQKEYNVAKRKFFRTLFDKINSDFDATIESAVKLLNEALPASAKEANKAAAK